MRLRKMIDRTMAGKAPTASIAGFTFERTARTTADEGRTHFRAEKVLTVANRKGETIFQREKSVYGFKGDEGKKHAGVNITTFPKQGITLHTNREPPVLGIDKLTHSSARVVIRGPKRTASVDRTRIDNPETGTKRQEILFNYSGPKHSYESRKERTLKKKGAKAGK